MLQAEQAVQALQDGEGGAGAIAVVADEAADEQAIALFDPGLIVLAIGAAPGEADLWRRHQPSRQPLTNSLPLSLCHSRRANGTRWAMAWMPPVTRCWCRSQIACSSVQVVATSTATSVAQ